MKKEICYAVMEDGSKIYYEKIGTGRPLFLLHGNGGSGSYFKHQVPTLSKYFQIFQVDSRGHNHSTNTQKQTSFQLMAKDLKTLMDQEKIKKAAILGFSDGANLAMVFAHQYPEMVDHLILNAGNTIPKGIHLYARIGSYIQYAVVFLCSFFSSGMKNFLPILSLLFHDIGLSTKDLQQIKTPSLVIVGKHDVVKTSHSMYIAKNLPNSSFVIVPGQGHQFARKNPQLFNNEILKFLKEK